jgi:hypothetical protein
MTNSDLNIELEPISSGCHSWWFCSHKSAHQVGRKFGALMLVAIVIGCVLSEVRDRWTSTINYNVFSVRWEMRLTKHSGWCDAAVRPVTRFVRCLRCTQKRNQTPTRANTGHVENIKDKKYDSIKATSVLRTELEPTRKTLVVSNTN